MTRLVGVQIANGYSSEARVFAQLLGERAGRYEAHVVMHQDTGGDTAAVDAFRARAACDVIPVDTGWRLNTGRRLGTHRVPVIARFYRSIATMSDLIRPLRPDVIYSGQQHYDFRAAAAIARRIGVPHVTHMHFTIGPWLKRRVITGIRKVDHVIAVSDYIRGEMIAHGIPPAGVTTIRNAMPVFPPVPESAVADLRHELGLTSNHFVVGMASRIDPKKGHDDAIAAFTGFAASAPDARLVIAGKGMLEAEVRALAAASPASDRILFLGQRADVPALLGLYDVFLHPSRDDPCPLAVLEALASARPVVAYGQGGTLELIDADVTGLLAELGDVAGLARHLQALHDDRDLRRELGTAAADRIGREFRPADAGCKFADLLDHLIGALR